MAMTKEDYMKLPKERLAELLVEAEKRTPFVPYYPYTDTMLCLYGGLCTNPLHDCVNCQRYIKQSTITCEK